MDTTRAAIAAEEVLTFLAYCAERITTHTMRSWDESYEGWLFRNGLLRRMQYLQSQKLLQRTQSGADWVWQLTETGRRIAAGGADPKARWNRPWDGWWRQIVFDLPVSQQRARSSLIRWLRANGFGYLQDSVWISPDPVTEVAEALKGHRQDAGSFTILECRCAPGFTNAALVRSAWPFEAINAGYRAYMKFVAASARQSRKRQMHPRSVFALLRAERKQWREAMAGDPLLPRALWPADYMGLRAWQVREEFLSELLTGLIGR